MKLVLIISILLVPVLALGQACCSAGVPLLGSLELPGTPAGSWQFSMSYEMNALRDVIAGTEELSDDLRERTVNSLLFETSFGISSRLSVSALFSLIQQEREINSPVSDATHRLQTRGIGDAVWLLKYNLLPLNMATQRELALGIGPKIPLGPNDYRNNGALIPADMQPGSGAWDIVLWGYVYQGFLPVTRFNLYGHVSSRSTGENGRGYAFGNEFISTISTSYRTETPFDYSLSVRYRSSMPDQFRGYDIPNTGGSWLSMIPGVNIKLGTLWSSRISGQIPVYRNLNGTQLTTSFRASVSLFYTIPGNNDSIGL